MNKIVKMNKNKLICGFGTGKMAVFDLPKKNFLFYSKESIGEGIMDICYLSGCLYSVACFDSNTIVVVNVELANKQITKVHQFYINKPKCLA